MELPPTPEILLAHGRFVQTLARALVRDAHAAEDVAQEAWVQWLRVERAGGARSARAWLRRAVRHLAANARRSGERRRRHEALGARAEPATAPDEELARAELLHRVVDAVFALEPPYRETILARYFRGRTARELARVTRTPLATVRSRERRALELLRARLDREHGGEAWAVALLRLAGRPEPLVASALALPALTAVLIGAAGAFAWLHGADARPAAPSVAGAQLSTPADSMPLASVARAGRTALPASDSGRNDVVVESLGTLEDAREWALVGTTVDTDGRPLAGIAITVTEPPRTAVSDASGTFHIAGVSRFRGVDASGRGYRLLSATDPESDPLGPFAPLCLTLARTATLAVTVRTVEDLPVAGVSVRVRPCAEELQSTGGDAATFRRPDPSSEAFTGAEGRAVLEDVWCDVHLTLDLEQDEEAYDAIARTDRQMGDALVLAGSGGAPIVCAPGEVRELRATWGAEHALRGRVLDADGAPVAGAHVRVVDEGRGERRDPGRTLAAVESESDGSFELLFAAAAPIGPLAVEALRNGPPHRVGADGRSAATVRVTAERAARRLELHELERAGELVLELAPNGLDVAKGTLTDGCGNPLSNEEHALVLLASGSSAYRHPDFMRVNTSGGGFIASSLVPGPYDLLLARGRDLGAPCPVFTRFTGLRPGGAALDLRGPSDASVRLRVRGEALALVSLARFFPTHPARFGRVAAPRELAVDRRAFWLAAEVASGVAVVERPEGTWVVASDDVGDSRAVEIPLGEPGWYAVGVASAAPLAPVATELLWFDAGEHVLDVRPPPATGVLRGRVVADGSRAFLGLVLADEHGRPFPIDAPSADPAAFHVRRIKASGEFLLRELAIGRYRLRAGTIEELATGRFAREVELEVVAGENPFLEIEL